MNTKPRLPFHAESIARCRQRYTSAISQIFDCRVRIPKPEPSSLRGHVFDCEDGMRLIISKERLPKGVFLHLSVSIEPGTSLWKQFEGTTPDAAQEPFTVLALARFAEISGDTEPLSFWGWTSGKGVPHWFRKVAD